jgi:ABC-type transport system involved in multi-copper enzyme maturation permease subunit
MMGLDPIGYRAWKGERSEHGRRFLVIADQVIREKLDSLWLIAVLALGTMLVHMFSIILMSITPHLSLTETAMADVFKGPLFYLFTVILVAMVCSDLIAEDMRSRSLTLYMSRALRPENYLAGKALGALAVVSIFTLLPPFIMAIAVTATQTGGDYLASLGVIVRALVASILATLFLVPLGLMLSSLTTRKTYAAVGTFMVIVVLQVIAGIFQSYDANWALLGPENILFYCYDAIFDQALPAGINTVALFIALLIMIITPTLLVYDRVRRKGVGN